jgi:hypothetical protein
MENPKSYVEGITFEIVVETLGDAYAILRGIAPSFIKATDESLDREYIKSRLQKEGLAFLTVTLPRLGEHFDRVCWGTSSSTPVGFKPYDGGDPCFLRPMWRYFRAWSYNEIDPATAQLIRTIRTLLLGFKKLEVPSSDEKIKAKIDSFLSIERELEDQLIFSSPILEQARTLLETHLRWKPVVGNPQHGPGAVAGREKHEMKWNFSTYYLSLHAEWPIWDTLYPLTTLMSSGYYRDRQYPLQLAANASHIKAMPRVETPTARMLLVPKDSRGPRIISCEPKELMYVQQGVSKSLQSYLERTRPFKGHVNFADQSVNSRMAVVSSVTRAHATVDMSDASDRISVALVKYLFPFWKKLLALRSTATVYNGKVIHLNKFAPMGSALCFPIESLVFWAIAVSVVLQRTGDESFALSNVFVYGDDIIIPSEDVPQFIVETSKVNLKVNIEKSFYGNHPFRESCGVDALNGYDVTPLRIKKIPPLRSSDASALQAYVDYAYLSQSICVRRSQKCLEIVERLIGTVPKVPFTQSFLSLVRPFCHWSYNDYNCRWSTDLCYFTSKLLTIKNRKRIEMLAPWSRLQRDLITPVQGASYVVERHSTQIARVRNNITYLEMSGAVG